MNLCMKAKYDLFNSKTNKNLHVFFCFFHERIIKGRYFMKELLKETFQHKEMYIQE